MEKHQENQLPSLSHEAFKPKEILMLFSAEENSPCFLGSEDAKTNNGFLAGTSPRERAS